ncbi:uncharacterized protein Adt_33109 [Abeliophyllum distichum]|uniref:Uncharacterized protein n=1 Tax=Abeliophyllum distichum TaxID=126358 RepID=A0ABD1QX99_9LAMI
MKQLEKYLRKTLPGSCPYQEKEKKNIEPVNNENSSKEDDLAYSDLLKLNVKYISKSYEWSNAIRNEKGYSIDKIKERKSISKQETKHLRKKFFRWHRMGIHQYTRKIKRVRQQRMFEFSTQPWKKNTEDETKRCNMIKDLRDHIVYGSIIASSQNLASVSAIFWKSCFLLEMGKV